MFLKTAFLNPGATMARVLDEIDKFPLPRQRNLPLSLIRRAVIGLLIPRIRGILNIHPLPVKMAEELDLALVKKISRVLGVEFRNSTLLFLPLDQLGFGFPSLFRINGELVIAALLRLLDHPLIPFRRVGNFVWNNWVCVGSDCVSPFSQPTAEGEKLKQLRQEPAKRLKSAQVFKEQTAWQEAPRLVGRCTRLCSPHGDQDKRCDRQAPPAPCPQHCVTRRQVQATTARVDPQVHGGDSSLEQAAF